MVLKRCEVCINDEGTARIEEVNGRFLCSECIKQLPHLPDPEKVRKELDEFMRGVDRAVLAFSGGKDSIVALHLARKRYNADIIAVMVDHGLMSEKAIENAKAIAEMYKVPLEIMRADFTDIFRDAIRRCESPCSRCSDRTMSLLRQYAREHGFRYIITGHELPFGSSAVRRMRGGIYQIRLLAMMPEQERMEILKRIGVELPELPGYTTNCLVIGVAGKLFCRKYGFSPEHRRLAALVRLGLMDRKRAEEMAKCPEPTKEQWNKVLNKLGIRESEIECLKTGQREFVSHESRGTQNTGGGSGVAKN